jgi:hypothetical protein
VIRLTRQGRRSTGLSKTDAMHPATQIAVGSRMVSREEAVNRQCTVAEVEVLSSHQQPTAVFRLFSLIARPIDVSEELCVKSLIGWPRTLKPFVVINDPIGFVEDFPFEIGWIAL